MLSGAEYCLATEFGDTFQLSKCSMDVNLANSWKLREGFSEVYDLFGDVVRCFVYTTMFSSHGFTGDISRQQKKALKGPRKT